VQSLEPNSPQLQALLPAGGYDAMIGEAPTNPISVTEGVLDQLIGGFLPNQTISTILGGQLSDMIVPINSQAPGPSSGQADRATVSGVVHANLCDGLPVISAFCSDVGETQSSSVWAQAYYWLTGGTGPIAVNSNVASSSSRANVKPLTQPSSAPAPTLNLTGYSQVSASNVTITPATGSIMTINSATNITATSSTNSITELLLLQNVTDPTDTLLLYATQAPFTIAFTPIRLGSSTFSAITVFSNNTYGRWDASYWFIGPEDVQAEVLN
jgi:hypothetical protein